MYCNKCGQTIEDKSTFCQYCGSFIMNEHTPKNDVNINSGKKKHNRKMLTISLLILSFVLLCAGIIIIVVFNVSKHNDIDFEKLYNDYVNLNQQAYLIEMNYVDEEGYIIPEKKLECLNELEQLAKSEKESNILDGYRIGTDYILFEFESGIPFYYSLDEKGMMSGNGLNEVMTIETSNFDWRMAFTETISGKPTDRAANRVVTELSNYYEFPDSNNIDTFDLDDIKLLEGKKVIIWNGHGGFDEKYGSILSVSTEVTDQDSLLVYSMEIANKEVVLAKNHHMAITAEYFKNKLSPDSLRGSLVYLAACHSMENNTLADILRSKGAEIVVGYTNSTYATWIKDTMNTFFEKLTTYYLDYSNLWTAEEARNYTCNKHGNYNIHDGNKSYFKIEPENSQFRLVDLKKDSITQQESAPPEKGYSTYTAEQLIDKTVPDIINIMGGDCTVEFNGDKTIYYTSDALYFYNYNAIPGFVFFIDEAFEDFQKAATENSNDYALGIVKDNLINNKYKRFKFMAVYNSAKYNAEITADMKYITISQILGDNKCQISGGVEYVTQEITNHKAEIDKAFIYYAMDDSFWNSSYKSGETIEPRDMSSLNPKIRGIVVFPAESQNSSDEKLDESEEDTEEKSGDKTNSKTDKKEKSSVLELSSYEGAVDLGKTFDLKIYSDYSLSELNISQSNPVFKINKWADGLNLVSLREGKTTIVVNDPEGNSVTCELEVIVTGEAIEDWSAYASSYPYHFVDETQSPYTYLYVDNVDFHTVDFRIEKGNLRISQTLNFTVINYMYFRCTDNMGNEYQGHIEMDNYNIFLELELVSGSDTNNLACNGRMIMV